MAVIKCKMCGGDIKLSQDKTFGTCESCGSVMTLPKVSDEQRAALFNRGNFFRRSGDFGKALAVYENIVREDDTDAEAHWCCVLCRYGIEYVEDPASFTYVPTCHRASFDSILEDVDYLAALEHSDGVTRRQYQRDAVQIAEVQRAILATSQDEEPFDVFICYKETDDDTNERTRDSIDAQEIYYQLTQAGYRVFFSRITLEDKAGTEYEPYIFAALHSAKIMLVIGSKPEYFQAVWVKNEWSRYLALMKKDRSKLMLPCYRGMDPYDLPEQLAVFQSYDMTKIGFVQDLLHGVKKVLHKDEPSLRETMLVPPNGNGNASALIKRGELALEDGEWIRADEFFEQALNIDAECAEAYLGKALAVKQCSTLQKLSEKFTNIVPNRETLTACQNDIACIDAISKKYALPPYLNEDDIRQVFNKNSFDFTYESIAKGCQAQIAKAEAYFTGDKLMGRAFRYASGNLAAKLADTRSTIRTALEAALAKARCEDEANIQRIKMEYASYLDNNEEAFAKLNQQAKKQAQSDYAAACAAMEKAGTESEFIAAGEQFRKLSTYLDSAEKCERCRREAEEMVKRQQAIREKQKKEHAAKNKKIAMIGSSALAVIIATILLVTQVIVPSNKYRNAEKLLEKGNTVHAAIEFGAAGNHKDAKKRAMILWEEVAQRDCLSAGDAHTVGLKADGSVVVVGHELFDQSDASLDRHRGCQRRTSLHSGLEGRRLCGGFGPYRWQRRCLRLDKHCSCQCGWQSHGGFED